LDIKKYQLTSGFLSEETSEGGGDLVQNAGISFAEKMSISWSVLKLTTTILFEVVNQVSSLLAFSSRKLCGATWSYGTTVPATWRGHTV
jgi:hypothetical protein